MSNDGRRPTTEPFSEGYVLVQDVEVVSYPDVEALMDEDLLLALRKRFGNPIVGRVGDIHYEFKAEPMIPPNTVAVPEDNHNDPDVLLINR